MLVNLKIVSLIRKNFQILYTITKKCVTFFPIKRKCSKIYKLLIKNICKIKNLYYLCIRNRGRDEQNGSSDVSKNEV
jgi:hypothetical protein